MMMMADGLIDLGDTFIYSFIHHNDVGQPTGT